MPRPANALIVDDEAHVLVFLRGLLKQLGVETIWEASHGQEALDKAAAHKPAVVLLDLNLPEMDGMNVLAKLKATQPSIPVIMVSAQTTMRSVDRAQELGAIGYVVKYAPKADVLKSISDHFDRIAAQTELPGAEPSPAGNPPPPSQ